MKVIKGNVVFLKNHNALVSINKKDFTNENHSLASIYIVRDPRDVVISYAKYRNLSYDRSIEQLCSKKLVYNLDTEYDFPRIEILGSWKFHYTSWRDGVPNMPKVIVRYEDLLDNCYNNFYKIIDFLSKILGFEINTEQLKFSIEFSNFEKLKKNEKRFQLNVILPWKTEGLSIIMEDFSKVYAAISTTSMRNCFNAKQDEYLL